MMVPATSKISGRSVCSRALERRAPFGRGPERTTQENAVRRGPTEIARESRGSREPRSAARRSHRAHCRSCKRCQAPEHRTRSTRRSPQAPVEGGSASVERRPVAISSASSSSINATVDPRVCTARVATAPPIARTSNAPCLTSEGKYDPSMRHCVIHQRSQKPGLREQQARRDAQAGGVCAVIGSTTNPRRSAARPTIIIIIVPFHP